MWAPVKVTNYSRAMRLTAIGDLSDMIMRPFSAGAPTEQGYIDISTGKRYMTQPHNRPEPFTRSLRYNEMFRPNVGPASRLIALCPEEL